MRTAELLDDDVAIAVRIRRDPPGERREPVDRGNRPVIGGRSPVTTFPAGGLPIVPIYRAVKRAATDIFAGEDVFTGVLALTRSGDRLVLSRSRFRPRHPSEVVRRLGPDARIAVDMPLLTDDLIPEITVGGETYTVNSTDFGVFARAVVSGDVDVPELVEDLTPYAEQTKLLSSYEPNSIRDVM